MVRGEICILKIDLNVVCLFTSFHHSLNLAQLWLRSWSQVASCLEMRRLCKRRITRHCHFIPYCHFHLCSSRSPGQIFSASCNIIAIWCERKIQNDSRSMLTRDNHSDGNLWKLNKSLNGSVAMILDCIFLLRNTLLYLSNKHWVWAMPFVQSSNLQIWAVIKEEILISQET